MGCCNSSLSGRPDESLRIIHQKCYRENSKKATVKDLLTKCERCNRDWVVPRWSVQRLERCEWKSRRVLKHFSSLCSNPFPVDSVDCSLSDFSCFQMNLDVEQLKLDAWFQAGRLQNRPPSPPQLPQTFRHFCVTAGSAACCSRPAAGGRRWRRRCSRSPGSWTR